jgi:hypothetical protein
MGAALVATMSLMVEIGSASVLSLVGRVGVIVDDGVGGITYQPAVGSKNTSSRKHSMNHPSMQGNLGIWCMAMCIDNPVRDQL